MSTTLLAVDDSVTMRKVLEITFSSEEFRVVTADSPEAALKKARSEKPAIILLDVTLPGQDGYALCKTLKAEMPGVPVLILSSKQGPYDAVKGAAAGADEFADKPFDTQQLIDKVKRVLQTKSAAPKAEPAPQPSPAAKPGGGTIPGTVAPSPATSPRQVPPQTQTFGSRPLTHPQPSPTTKIPSLSGSAEVRTRTASGLGNAAAVAQVQAEKVTQPVLPIQVKQDPTPVPPGATPAPTPAPTPSPTGAPTPTPSPLTATVEEQLGEKLAGLGLTPAQADAVLALSREVVERVVWEVVPVLAETLIKEEIKRLTSE
ncbi:MAG: response regulator [Myxococcales bacterium]|nr:response regulator [Polyangiaceae bacterium]MDW8250094.1 response regulator [Myxococcales bacterium]